MADRELHEKLVAMGFTLIRESPHLIYRHINGKQFTTGATPGDFRHRQNALSDAAIVAGLSNQGREAREGERRRKKRSLAPAAVDPRGRGPAIAFIRPEPVRVNVERLVAVTVEDGEVSRRTVPVQIRNIADYEPKPKPLPKVPVAHRRAVDSLPRGMRERVLKLAAGDYTRIKILADNRVEVASR